MAAIPIIALNINNINQISPQNPSSPATSQVYTSPNADNSEATEQPADNTAQETTAENPSSDNSEGKTASESSGNISEEELLTGMLRTVYSDKNSDEGQKALAVFFNNNIYSDKGAIDCSDPKNYITDEKFREISGNSYEQASKSITAAADFGKSKKLVTHDGKSVFIPWSQCSNGATYADDSIPELSAVASPWDCFSENYSPDNRCVGISIDGIIAISSSGTYEEILKRYLPDFSQAEI